MGVGLTLLVGTGVISLVDEVVELPDGISVEEGTVTGASEPSAGDVSSAGASVVADSTIEETSLVTEGASVASVASSVVVSEVTAGPVGSVTASSVVVVSGSDGSSAVEVVSG